MWNLLQSRFGNRTNLNVKEKINKLRNQLLRWKSRNLTMEGKSLILKTFGISQLIYNMQCIKFEVEDLIKIEKLIFNFIWGKKEIDDNRGRDRIKRSVMKNEYQLGGLNITDVECLDSALKLKQYIRANKANHNIKVLQQIMSGKQSVLAQEFQLVSTNEIICNSAQSTINKITDSMRESKFNEQSDDLESKLAIELIAKTDVETYLKRKSRVFLSCIFGPLKKSGLVTFIDLANEGEVEMDRKKLKKLESILCAFPKYFREAAKS
jgi:hypothetical protein